MKHVDLFNDFLKDTVNLNQTRITSLKTSADALEKVISEGDWGPNVRAFGVQGSWAHGTIIKPVSGGMFDADLLVYVDPVDDWDAKAYLDRLYDLFRNNGTYKDKVRRCSHCVTVDYTGDKNIDIAVIVVERSYASLEVCNRTANAFEDTDPGTYTDWLIERNRWTANNMLRKVTRLLKYQRDIKTTFTCPSVLLTTLIGNTVYVLDNAKVAYPDVPTALKTVVDRLDDFLQGCNSRPQVPNPALPKEHFGDLWTDDQFDNFRNVFHRYREWVDDAYDEPNKGESLSKWRKVFGDEFAADEVEKAAAQVSRVALAKAFTLAQDAAGDIVDLVRRFGARVLPDGFGQQPHMKRPTWRESVAKVPVSVRAAVHESKQGTLIGPLMPLQAVRPGLWLQFRAVQANDLPFDPSLHNVHWRITNTGDPALKAKGLRGGFEPSNDGNTRWEHAEYRGVHIAEAFVVRRADNVLIGESPPFYVAIE